MSWIVIGDEETSCFGCNTTDKVFGDIFFCSADDLHEFGLSLPKDVREYGDDELMKLFNEWEKVREV